MAKDEKDEKAAKPAKSSPAVTVTATFDEKKGKSHDRNRGGAAGGGAVYCLGLIGAAVYYIQESTGFGEFLVACLKALVWPAFVVYDLLGHIS